MWITFSLTCNKPPMQSFNYTNIEITSLRKRKSTDLYIRQILGSEVHFLYCLPFARFVWVCIKYIHIDQEWGQNGWILVEFFLLHYGLDYGKPIVAIFNNFIYIQFDIYIYVNYFLFVQFNIYIYVEYFLNPFYLICLYLFNLIALYPFNLIRIYSFNSIRKK